jgi:hypothetical protein
MGISQFIQPKLLHKNEAKKLYSDVILKDKSFIVFYLLGALILLEFFLRKFFALDYILFFIPIFLLGFLSFTLFPYFIISCISMGGVKPPHAEAASWWM